MKKKNRKNNKAGIITVGGNFALPGQKKPNVIVLTQPKRFGLDIADYMAAVKAAENVDFSRRYKLYDLYEDILMDTHLSCVIEKRKNAVLCSNMEFRVDGKPDDKINEQIQSPWFNRLVGDILDAKFWGFSLCQFYKLQEWVDYDLVPRKHVDPVRELILRHQTDITGHSWDEYTDLLFVGSPSDLGLLAKAAPWVIYKRNTTGDWAQFSEVFGMPIQEYIYDSDDDESRQRAMEDAANAGSLAQFFHAKDTELKLTEAGNKTGSADVYERLCERCNNEISKLILGNTLTTESSEKGTQALGTVHKKVEDKVLEADRKYVLNVLNYDMTDILLHMGINTEGGTFCFPEPKETDAGTKISILTQLKKNFSIPIDDDYLYEEFGIDKPANYEQLKAEQREAAQAALVPTPKKEPEPANKGRDDEPTPKQKKKLPELAQRFFRESPGRRGSFRLVMNDLYQNKGEEVQTSFSFSSDVLAKALQRIYSQKMDVEGEIEPNLFHEICRILDDAAADGVAQSEVKQVDDFLQQLQTNNEVFAAFKVHRMQRDMVRLLFDSNGTLKPFEKWVQEVTPIASHQVRHWLQTEYDTAVLRAHQAADWQQFLRERDVLPNLKWMPSTSLHPGADHRPFWNTIRPIDDPFWSKHRPGDRWNCKCDLTATDEEPTQLPDDDNNSKAQPGLDNNPGTDGILFSDSHPYFPNDCKHCAFYKPDFKNRLIHIFSNRARDCYDCPYIKACLERMAQNGFKLEKSFSNGGVLYVHPKVDKDKADYKDMKRICLQLARMGHQVKMTPRLHYLSDDYQRIYANLIDTRYYRKCPDFEVDGLFYEFEGFIKPWNKRKVKSMISHGLEQSSRIVIKNTKGCSDRFIRRAIMARRNLPNQNIDEVWIYEKGEIRLFYKDGKFYY